MKVFKGSCGAGARAVSFQTRLQAMAAFDNLSGSTHQIVDVQDERGDSGCSLGAGIIACSFFLILSDTQSSKSSGHREKRPISQRFPSRSKQSPIAFLFACG